MIMKWRYCNLFLTDSRLMLPCKATLCSLSACYVVSWSSPTHNLWRHSLRGGFKSSVQFQEKFNVGRSLQEELGRSIIKLGVRGAFAPRMPSRFSDLKCNSLNFCRLLILILFFSLLNDCVNAHFINQYLFQMPYF